MWRLLCHALGLAIVSGSSQLGEEGGRGEEVGGSGGRGVVCLLVA